MERAVSLFLFLPLLTHVAAFPLRTRQGRSLAPSSWRMSSTGVEEQVVPIILNGQNIELTPALVDYVNKRIGGPLKKLAFRGAITECDVVLQVNKNPKVKSVTVGASGVAAICVFLQKCLYRTHALINT
jgi:hypothetical protein